jgi:hypothetical protein
MFTRRDSRKMTLEEKVQLLMDEKEIRDVLYRDNRGKSRSDLELVMSCFWPDAWDHHQPWFDAQAHQVFGNSEGSGGLFRMIQYMTTQSLIDLEGDVARVESYAISAKVFHERSAAGDKILRLSGIRNLDRFERRDGEWRIAERQLLPEWGCFQEVSPLAEPISIYGVGTDADHVTADPSIPVVKGSTDRSDPSYSATYSFMAQN